MVAFFDVTPCGSGDSPRRSEDRRLRKSGDAGRLHLAGLMRFAGIVLLLAGVGLWLVGVPWRDAEMMLVRLAASILFFCAAVMLLRGGRSHLRDEIQLDLRSGEMRHVQRGRDGIARTRRSVKLADLGAITIVDDQVILKSVTGQVVMHLFGLPRAQLQLIERKLRNF